MIKLFRNIRQKLINEGKTTNYLKYAIGEIILVVIGILIALQVNNWNENRKQNIQKNLLIQSLIADLKMDTTMLNKTLKILAEDTTRVLGYTKRMSGNHLTIDTLIHIARYEFNPELHFNTSFNNNTLQSLMSTGNLNILDRWIQKDILELNEMHETYIARTNLNSKGYVDQIIVYARKYPLKDYGNISPKSKLADEIWRKVQFSELGSQFNALLAIRNVTNLNAIEQLKEIHEKTSDIIERLDSINNKSFHSN